MEPECLDFYGNKPIQNNELLLLVAKLYEEPYASFFRPAASFVKEKPKVNQYFLTRVPC